MNNYAERTVELMQDFAIEEKNKKGMLNIS